MSLHNHTQLRYIQERAGKKLPWKSAETGRCSTLTVLVSDPGRELESLGVLQEHTLQRTLGPTHAISSRSLSSILVCAQEVLRRPDQLENPDTLRQTSCHLASKG